MKDQVKKTVILTTRLKKDGEELAKKKSISFNALIRVALSEYIERNK